ACALVMMGEGDRRASLNALWEWVSVGVTYLLLRDALRSEEQRRLLSQGLLITVLTLSLFGFWQHVIWYPAQSQRLTRFFELQERVDSGASLTPAEQRRHRQLISELGTDVLTLDSTGRQMLLARTQGSLEPLGRFALANTFAGLLA